jgi:hypothetical protein
MGLFFFQEWDHSVLGGQEFHRDWQIMARHAALSVHIIHHVLILGAEFSWCPVIN